MLRHLRFRPAMLTGLLVLVVAFLAAMQTMRPVTASLVAWDCGVVAYATVLCLAMRHHTTEQLRTAAAALDESQRAILLVTLAAAIASLGAIVAELAQVHGKPHAGWIETLAGATVILSWFFVHTVFATHYAHAFWRRGGLSFPGNDSPGYGEFLYFSFCMAVASQVSDVSTQLARMRRLVLVHSLIAYLFNTAIIALGVNIAASLAS